MPWRKIKQGGGWGEWAAILKRMLGEDFTVKVTFEQTTESQKGVNQADILEKNIPAERAARWKSYWKWKSTKNDRSIYGEFQWTRTEGLDD